MALSERFRGLTVAACLRNRAITDPEDPFLLFDDHVLTYGEAEAQAESLAAAFHQLGIESGDRIALVLPNWPEFVTAMFAATKLGAVVVPLNPRLSTPELKYMLRHSEAVAAVTAEELDGDDHLELFEEFLVQLPELQYAITVGEEDLWYDDRIFQFEDLVSTGEGRDFPVPEVDPSEDPFAILYTSGTTGKPKGVTLTHRNVLAASAGTADAIDLDGDDRISGVTAFFHVFGLGPGVVGTMLAGAALLLEDTLEAGTALDLIERHRVTVHHGVPTSFVEELSEQRERPRDVSSLRTGVVAGAPVSEELARTVREELCPGLQIAYSLTETAATVCITRPTDPPEKQRFTVGTPIPDTSVRILEEDGSELPVESVGEIAVRGPGVMKGYYRQPVETSGAFDEEGYFLTGDLGIIDEEGYIHLVGRRKELIIRGGFNVHPREVEDRLQANPAVRDAAVIGIPHDVLGEAICACVVPVEGAIVTGDEIEEWCRATLAGYKVPDMVRFLDALPMTGSGSIRRVELARMIKAEESSRRR